jgi:hypothetical protein
MKVKRYIAPLLFITALIPFRLDAFTIVQTPRALPDGGLESSFEQKIINNGNTFLTGRFTLASAVNERIILSGCFDMIEKTPSGLRDGIGDCRAGLSYYFGSGDKTDLSFCLFSSITFPTGPDVAREPLYSNVSLGRSELSFGSGCRLNIGDATVQSSISYVARQGESALFGIHFFSKERVRNDYVRFSAGANSLWWGTVVPSIECGVSSPLEKGRGVLGESPVEGGSIRPVDCAIGLRYCFSDSGSVDFHFIEPIVKKRGYLRESASLRVIIQF